MNFLAHVFLSGNDFELAMGNLIADQIKGKKYLDLPPKIQEGVLLHRKIDHYTDSHPAFKQCIKKLFVSHRHYSRVLVDMFFDHFLAKNWQQYHPQLFPEFIHQFYDFIEKNKALVPERCTHLIEHLIQNNWFGAYASLDGLETILAQMEKRTRFESHLALGRIALEKDYFFYKTQFNTFFINICTHFKIDIP
jgi:acyl carrier protein phosphodiesterase